MINYACRYFRGSKPCAFNKLDGSECPTCRHASPFEERILFIKLDAIGDVLRSASLLPTIKARHRAPYIAWLTRRDSFELVSMMEDVDEVIEFDAEGMQRAINGGWDQVYSLSNDLPSASVATAAAGANTPVGYFLRHGVIAPSNPAAELWLEMAAFDRLKRANQQSYQRRMLDILGADDANVPAPALRVGAGERAAAEARLKSLFGGADRRRVAINVGSGGRWPKKMMYAEEIYSFARRLQQADDVDIVLVGGRAEAAKSEAILAMRQAGDRMEAALTDVSVPEFVAVLAQVDGLLCGDTLALHIATAVGLPTVAVFGPTNQAEIHTFDGLIAKAWARDLECLVCYGDCAKPVNCMTLMDIDGLVSLMRAQLQRRSPRQAAA
jgi:ADP-heptose:LPS heptosyltransferase